MRKPSDPAFRWTAVPLIAALLAIVFGGAVFYKFQENRQRRQVEASLAAIARLKADQIAAWRAERIGDARVIMDRQTLINDINDYFTRPEEAGERAIKRRLETLKTSYRYANILLVDPDGRVRLSLNGHDVIDHTGFTDALTASLRDHKPVFTDLHTEKNDPAPHISVIAPLFSEDEPLRPVGAAVLISNAMDFLFPLIQSWPVPSRSSETLLVRRDGDHVLFLNDLRHMPDTALRLRIPVSRADLPAAMAVLGRQGVVAGKDYRGVEVLSVVLPVPDSPWFIVSKIDADE
ncbi:MAG: cache domain-containing protein, partial [Thermodesulfobacteriota bacterium]